MRQLYLLCKKNRTFILLFFSVLSGILFLRLFLSIWGRVPPQNYRVLTEMSVEVLHEDGSIDHFDSHLFNFSSNKDKIILHLPLKESWKKEHQAINFFFYNSVVKAYYKDKLIASFGENLKRHMIGNLKVCIPVPIEAYGDEIRVEIFPKMPYMENNFDSPVMMAESDSLFFTIIGQETSYVIFVMTVVATFLAMMMFAFFSSIHIYAREGFWLMSMIFAITLWHLGNSGMMYMLTNYEDMNAVAEYIGMYLLLSTAPLYASYETERPLVKKYLRIAGSILFFLFLLSIALYLLPTGYTYVWHLRWAQGVQIVMLLSTIVSLIFPGRVVKNTSDHILGVGLVYVAILGIMEQVRLILSASVTHKWPLLLQWFVKVHYSKVLIILMIFVFITAFSFKLILVMQRNLEDEHLRVLAFSDNLTALGNRQYLQRKLDVLDNQHLTDYGVIFIDINDLKYTNDHFGHESGDQLIRMVALAIKGAVSASCGFCGRNGGDEFIAVISPEEYLEEVSKQILENLENIKEKEKTRFPVSISLGTATYSEVSAEIRLEGEIVTTGLVIQKADQRMYEAKSEYKKSKVGKAFLENKGRAW